MNIFTLLLTFSLRKIVISFPRTKCSNCSLERITKPDECWCCMEIDRCREKMEESKHEGKCIVDHPGFEVCCLNNWGLETAYVGLKTRSKRS